MLRPLGLLRPIYIVTLFECTSDALGLPAEHIVIILVQVHHFFEVVLASLDTPDQFLINPYNVPHLGLNLLLGADGLSDQTVDFVKDASLLLLHLLS